MGFDPGFERPTCLAILKSSDRMKQFAPWMNIYIYIYIYIFDEHFDNYYGRIIVYYHGRNKEMKHFHNFMNNSNWYPHLHCFYLCALVCMLTGIST